MPGLQTLSIMGMAYYGLAIITHILILTRIIPYTSVNGERSASYEDQARVSGSNIVVASGGIILMVLVFIDIGLTRHWSGLVIFGVLSLFWLMGFVMQLLGTFFEKTFMSVIVLFGIVVHVALFIHAFQAVF